MDHQGTVGTRCNDEKYDQKMLHYVRQLHALIDGEEERRTAGHVRRDYGSLHMNCTND